MLKSFDPSVQALIIVWGGQVAGTPATLDGVTIVHRSELRSEMDSWKKTAPVLSLDEVNSVSVQLHEYRVRQADQNATKRKRRRN
jgi:hypothetical protein